jgi:hypothetical protein
MNRRLFMAEQESLDMAWGCISEAHIWEALNEAVNRMNDFLGRPMHFPAGQYGAFIFGSK